PWAPPGGDPTPVSAPPAASMPDGTGVTVCMHVRGYQATASSLIAELPSDTGRSVRAWVAPGSPCVSVYVPVFPPDGVPRELGDALAERLREGLGQALGSVQHDHLVDLTERLGGRLDDRGPVLGELLADDGVLVLGQRVGPRLDRLGLGHALGPHRLALRQPL